MNVSIFEDNLDRYGGDFASWPLDLRDAAADFARGSIEAAAALRATTEVERFLASSRPSTSGPDRLAETASRYIQARPAPRNAQRAAWAAAAMVMLVLGLFVGDIRPTSDDGVDVLMATSFEPMGATDVD